MLVLIAWVIVSTMKSGISLNPKQLNIVLATEEEVLIKTKVNSTFIL